MHRIRLAENFRAAFYGPFYATQELGFFDDEKVAVELVHSATPGSANSGLLDGSLDVSWGGPMRVLRDRNQADGIGLMAFCEVVARDPFYLVARPGLGSFSLADLQNLRFGSTSEVPTPWLCLQHDLRQLDIDPARLDRIPDRTMGENLAALSAGTLDVAQMFEPFASTAEREGKGRIVHAASARGETCYTTFLSLRETIARRNDAFAAMTRAIARMQAWLGAHGADELARIVAAYYPDIAFADLAAAYRRYADAGLWSKTPEVSRAGLDRLARSLKSGGFITSIPPYEDCVATPA
ncbi:MAG: ABC transporter substrate-binding protein [Hyphomicrobiaceae bacterium]